ncbi:MAG: DUF1343 domain-containing protein [Vicinamibacterales bacterium]
MTPVIPGCERLGDRLRGRRYGLVANPASVTRTLVHVADHLRLVSGGTLGALFGPQHGFLSTLQDNMIETPHAHDVYRSVPVFSLYSDTREPTSDMLADLDVLVVDLQDVGTRVYTFVYTMANCLKAAAKVDLPVIVCDRPNPIGGMGVEGPMLEPGLESFVGQFPIPLRHGMTIGELAWLFNDYFELNAPLEVVTMEGWTRATYLDETGVPWVMPSPNMPTLDTAIVYPGAVLFEGTQLSEGRGTTRPFELIGAPWIDSVRLARTLNDLGLEGVFFRPISFQPTFHKFEGQPCGGVQMHVTERDRFAPVLASTALMSAMYQANPSRFAWREPPYEYEHDKVPIDILAGTSRFREAIEAGFDARDLAASWRAGVGDFLEVRDRFLFYRT